MLEIFQSIEAEVSGGAEELPGGAEDLGAAYARRPHAADVHVDAFHVPAAAIAGIDVGERAGPGRMDLRRRIHRRAELHDLVLVHESDALQLGAGGAARPLPL